MYFSMFSRFARNVLFFISVIAGVTSLIASVKDGNNMLNLNMKTQPKTFDPRKAGDVFSSQVIFLLFEGLVKQYPDGSIKLAQAKSYTVSDDKRVYTFTLGDNVWSNDKPVTAYDFEQSWKDILNPEFPTVCDYAFSSIKNAESAKRGIVPLDQVGIKALDEKTLVITLERPTPYFLKLLCLPPFFPVNIEQDRKNSNWVNQSGAHYVCNGPFILEVLKQGDQIVLVNNPRYRKTKDMHPEKIVFNIVENDHVTLEMFKQGSIDMIGDSLTDIPLEETSELEKKWIFSLEPQPYSIFIYLNTNKYPFNNRKIRKAFGLAINRQELIGMLGKGPKRTQANVSATNIVSPCLKKNRCHGFFKDNDIDQANALLKEGMAELGITKDAFRSLTLTYYSRVYGAEELVQIIQQQLAKAFGIFIKLEKLDFSIAIDKMTKGDYAMCLSSWLAFYQDPMNVLERFKHKKYTMNFPKWENPQFIKLLERSNHEEGNERLVTLEEAEGVLIDDMPVIPLYHQDYVYLVNPNLKSKVSLWGDRLLFPLSSEQKRIQKANKKSYGK